MVVSWQFGDCLMIGGLDYEQHGLIIGGWGLGLR
jgi:hypothetical protein